MACACRCCTSNWSRTAIRGAVKSPYSVIPKMKASITSSALSACPAAVAYLNKKLTINSQPVPEIALPDYFDEERMAYTRQYRETVDARSHVLLKNPAAPGVIINTYD